MTVVSLSEAQGQELADYLLGKTVPLAEALEYIYGDSFEDGVELDMDGERRLAGRVFQCMHCRFWVECADVDEVYELRGVCNRCTEPLAAQA